MTASQRFVRASGPAASPRCTSCRPAAAKLLYSRTITLRRQRQGQSRPGGWFTARELLRQASAKLTWLEPLHGIIAAGFRPDPDQLVEVGSIQAIIRRLGKVGEFDLIIFDEAHHCQAETWRKLVDAFPKAKLLGVTATPCPGRWAEGLGIENGGCFDKLVVGPTIPELVAAGFRSSGAQCFVPAQRIDLKGVRTQAGDDVANDLAAVVDTASITGDAVSQSIPSVQHISRQSHSAPRSRTPRTLPPSSALPVIVLFASMSEHHGWMDAAIAGLGNGDARGTDHLRPCRLQRVGRCSGPSLR